MPRSTDRPKVMQINKILLTVCFLLVCPFAISANEVPTFAEGDIRVGACNMHVLIAQTDFEKARGMAGFTDDTFPYDGMIFLGDMFRKHTYQTVTMRMNIRIMGLNRVSEDKYKVYGGAVYAPVGLTDIIVSGESVLEIPERAFASKFKDCIYQF